MKLVHLEHAFDLGQQSCQQPEVASSHPDQPRDDLRCERLVWKSDPDRRPALL
jgi:hypothetical protein